MCQILKSDRSALVRSCNWTALIDEVDLKRDKAISTVRVLYCGKAVKYLFFLAKTANRDDLSAKFLGSLNARGKGTFPIMDKNSRGTKTCFA